MDERDVYILPLKKKRVLDRKAFVVWCVLCSVLFMVIMDGVTYMLFQDAVGFFPTTVVIFFADILSIAGCIYYIKKHDYAYGPYYEKYQIINASIYGIQNYLRVLLVAMVISFVIVPLLYILVVFAIVGAMFGWTRRLWR